MFISAISERNSNTRRKNSSTQSGAAAICLRQRGEVLFLRAPIEIGLREDPGMVPGDVVYLHDAGLCDRTATRSAFFRSRIPFPPSAKTGTRSDRTGVGNHRPDWRGRGHFGFRPCDGM